MEHDKTAGLILRARNGDADAFVELMEQNKQSMYKTAKAWLVKVAESLTITVTENPDLAYMTEEEKAEEARLEQEAEEAWEAAVNYGVAPEEITAVGEALEGSDFIGASYTVEEAAFYDSLYEAPGAGSGALCAGSQRRL